MAAMDKIQKEDSLDRSRSQRSWKTMGKCLDWIAGYDMLSKKLMICFIFSLFRCPTLSKKVTLGAEVGEEVALGVLAAQILEKAALASLNPRILRIQKNHDNQSSIL